MLQIRKRTSVTRYLTVIFETQLSGLDWCARRHRRLLKPLQNGHQFHAAVNPKQCVRVERYSEEVFERDENQSVDRIQSHTEQKRPVLAFARKTPEDDKYTGHKTIDDQIERERGAACLVSQ